LTGSVVSGAAGQPRNTGNGMALALFGGMVLSFDIPLIRLADGDVWSVMTVRCLGVGLAGITLYALARFLKWDGLRFDFSRPALLASAAYTITSITFICAVFLTSTANVVFILAFTGMFAALLGWLMNGERPAIATLLTLGATVVGVLLIVGDGLTSGRWTGDFLALVTSFLLAAAITITRRHDLDLRINVLAANVASSAFSGLMMLLSAQTYIHAPEWSLLNGLIVIPLSFLCLAYAPRLLFGPVVAMAYLLETIFAPIWVWFIFKESPTTMTLIGGSIMLSAILAHGVWELRQAKR
jgi:drug/metabolite transporter (DMT)-like permease